MTEPHSLSSTTKKQKKPPLSARITADGRINRKDFIFYLILYLLGLSLFPIFVVITFEANSAPIPSPIPEILIIFSALVLPVLSAFILGLLMFLCIKRLHDIGKSGGVLGTYLIAITLINHYLPDDIFKYMILPSLFLPFLYLSIAPGTKGPNIYDTPDNKNKQKEQKTQ